MVMPYKSDLAAAHAHIAVLEKENATLRDAARNCPACGAYPACKPRKPRRSVWAAIWQVLTVRLVNRVVGLLWSSFAIYVAWMVLCVHVLGVCARDSVIDNERERATRAACVIFCEPQSKLEFVSKPRDEPADGLFCVCKDGRYKKIRYRQ